MSTPAILAPVPQYEFNSLGYSAALRITDLQIALRRIGYHLIFGGPQVMAVRLH